MRNSCAGPRALSQLDRGSDARPLVSALSPTPPLLSPTLAGKPTYSIVYNNGTLANLTTNTASTGAGGFAIFPAGGCAHACTAQHTCTSAQYPAGSMALQLPCSALPPPSRPCRPVAVLPPCPSDLLPTPPPCRPAPRRPERGLLPRGGAGGVPCAHPRRLLLPPLRGARRPGWLTAQHPCPLGALAMWLPVNVPAAKHSNMRTLAPTPAGIPARQHHCLLLWRQDERPGAGHSRCGRAAGWLLLRQSPHARMRRSTR